jgi:hypothetical protein
MSRRWARGWSAAVGGVLAFALPAVASAAADARGLALPDDASRVMLVTALTVVAVFLVAILGRLYQIRRTLHWRFQDPDEGDHAGGD